MNKTIYGILILMFLTTCKKEELNGDLSYLEGKWKFHASINNQSGSVTYTNSMAFNQKDMHYLEFKHNGRVILYNYQNKIIERGRLRFISSSPSNIYPSGIFYEVDMGSNSVFNRKLNKLTYITLISTSQIPFELIINDIIYESPVLELVFQKM